MPIPSTNLLSGSFPEEIEEWVKGMGEKPFRAKQLVEWIFEKRVASIDGMTNLPKAFRERLKQDFQLSGLLPVKCEGSKDTTRKYLFRLHDGRFIESVLIPANLDAKTGDRSNRHTICVSSQVGCAYDCKFCASGLAGFTRNLTTGEIVDQLLQVEALSGEKINNVVFMGMGEPLANLKNVARAIQIINAPWGMNIGARHITVSTSGVAPQIRKLADQPLQIRLAISLHGATDEVRERIMPVNKKYPLEVLFKELRYYNSKKKQKITFEYILIEDVNDSLDQANELASRARHLGAKINLIPYNKVEGLEWKRPSIRQQEAFLKTLTSRGASATLRREKGHDIEAACGQLRLREEANMDVPEGTRIVV